MTKTNRRQLARVRNAFLGATALAGLAGVATPASAIVINDNFTPTQAVDTAGGVNGVGQMVVDEQNGFIGLCTVSLINPRTVIFASHCVNENPAETAFMPATGYGSANGGLPIGFFFNVNNNQAGNSAIGHWLNGVSGGPKDQTRTAEFAYNSNFVVYNTNCCTIGLGNNFLQSDIAMAALDTPAVGIPTYTLLFTALSAPTHATITGYGDNGIGTTGQGTIDFKRRIAENVVSVLGSLDDQDTFLFGAPDGLPANLYMMDFNDPKFNTAQANAFDFNVFHDTAYTHEGITAPGDSGGPLIIDHQFGAPTIAAVLSGGDRFFNAQPGASYGTTSFYQPLYLYWDWILSNNPYKYVSNVAGNHNWRDAGAFQMMLDPAYVTVNGSGQLVNALPTTPAQGEANVPPGFGEVCYFDDCINIKTGAHTNPTPAPGPNPTTSSNPAQVPVNGLGLGLGQAGFDALVEGYVAAQNASSQIGGGPASVAASLIGVGDTGANAAPADGSVLTSDASGGSSGSSTNTSPQSNWTNPEGSALVNGVSIQGAPGASPGQIVQDTNANTATGAPARYYDVNIINAGTTTLDTGSIIVDRVTVNGANSNLVVAAGATLSTLINYNSFSGTSTINGTLNSMGSASIAGGVLQGTGTVNAPSVDLLIGAIAPGTNGQIGTLTINGNFNPGLGGTTLIDITNTTSDLLKVNGITTLSGTLLVNPVNAPHFSDTHTILTSTTLNGAFAAVPDTIPGVLRPVVTKVAIAGGFAEVLSFQADTFASVLGGPGTVDQTTIGGALDALRAGNYTALKSLYDAIDPLAGASLGQALEDLAPDAERAATLVGDMQVTGYDLMLSQHLLEVGGGQGGTQTAGLHINGDGLRSALNSASVGSGQSQQLLTLGAGIANGNPGGGNAPITTGAEAAAPTAAGDTWMSLGNNMGGFVSGSSLNGTVGIGGGGGKADVRGYIIGGGLDTVVVPNLTVGVSAAYSDADASLRAMPSQLSSKTFQGALYARYDFGSHFFAEAFASAGGQDIDTQRFVVVGATTFDILGKTTADVYSVGAFVGHSVNLPLPNGNVWNFTPGVGLQYTDVGIDGFTETGGAPAMTFHDYHSGSGLARFGLDTRITVHVFGIPVTPNAHLYYVDNFSGDNGTIQSTFAAAPGSVLSFAGIARDQSYGELGAGLDFDLSGILGHEATLSGRYDGTADREDLSYGSWTGRLSIKF